MAVKAIGGIKTSLKNFRQTFIEGLGYLHSIAGTFFVVFCATLFFEKSYITGVNTDTFDFIVSILMFLVGSWGVGYVFGWGIEEIQVKFFKSNEINYNDMWWTSTGFVLADAWLYSAPQEWWKPSCIVSGIIILLMGALYIYFRKTRE